MEITRDPKDTFFVNLLSRALVKCFEIPPEVLQIKEENDEEERSK